MTAKISGQLKERSASQRLNETEVKLDRVNKSDISFSKDNHEFFVNPDVINQREE